LRTAQATEKCTGFAFLVDSKHAIIAGCRRPRDKEFSCWAEREMIRRYGRFEFGKDENLAVRTNLKNCAAAIADEKITDRIERNSSRRSHAFDPKLRAAIGRDAMDGSVVAAGDVEKSFAVKREARGIHKLGDEGFYFIVGGDLVERYGHLLSAVAAIGDLDVSFNIHRRIRHGVKIVGNLHADVHRERFACGARSFNAHAAVAQTFRDARDQIIVAGDQQAGFGVAKAHARPNVRR